MLVGIICAFCWVSLGQLVVREKMLPTSSQQESWVVGEQGWEPLQLLWCLGWRNSPENSLTST